MTANTGQNREKAGAAVTPAFSVPGAGSHPEDALW